MPFDIALVRSLLPDRVIVYRETTASTMIDAAEAARGRCPYGTLVVAGAQTSGHGRFERKWHSEPDTGLYVSVVLRLALPPESIPCLTLALGLAAADAISSVSGVAPDLRWPNDVMASGRKCAGILTKQESGAFIAGIGVNVNQQAFPPDVADIATSLRIETGRQQSREDLLVALARSIDRHAGLLARSGRPAILDLFAARSTYVRGMRVAVERTEGDEIFGVTDGLDEHGFLYVRKDDGARELILAGGVRPARAK